MILAKCVLQINLDIIRDNYQALQKKFTGSTVAAAVKANCYGLGMSKIVPVLLASGCQHFFVANKDEGLKLKKVLNGFKDRLIDEGISSNINFNAIRVYILNGYFNSDEKDFRNHGLIPVINSLAQLELWQNLALKLNKNLPCFLHLDTGMNRYGMPEHEVKILVKDFAPNNLNILCVMSHLCSAEYPQDSANAEQLTKFKALANLFPKVKKSLVNSSGIFLSSDYHFDIARPGAAIYGINPTPHLENSVIKNPLLITAPIIGLNYVKAGEYIGYNRTYQAAENRLIATIPIGYADGYPRSLSNKGMVYINNKPAPIVGRISMDLTNIDVTNLPKEDLFLGQNVEIIGQNINLDKIANLAGTNGYEILTMIGNRYARVYNTSNPVIVFGT